MQSSLDCLIVCTCLQYSFSPSLPFKRRSQPLPYGLLAKCLVSGEHICSCSCSITPADTHGNLHVTPNESRTRNYISSLPPTSTPNTRYSVWPNALGPTTMGRMHYIHCMPRPRHVHTLGRHIHVVVRSVLLLLLFPRKHMRPPHIRSYEKFISSRSASERNTESQATRD